QTDRVLLTSKHTGAANQIVIVNQLADSHDGAPRPDFSGPVVQQATNAAIVLGSGPGAITVESASNQIDGLIEGVTLNITSVDANQDVVITVSRDTAKAQQAIQDFVSEFNSLMEYLDEQTKYNTATQTASPLTGQRSVSVLKNQLLTMVTGNVPGLDSSLNRFSQVGITINANGRLSVNSTRLASALNGQLDGVAADSVARLFGMTASISNPGIEFVLGSSRTKASTSPYQIDIVQAAEQAVMAATNALNDPIVIDATNRQFEIQVDGIRSETLMLAEGTYTPSELAEHLQSIINSSAVLGNREVAVSIADNRIQITSMSYGSNSKVSSFIGTAAALLGFVGSETAVGKDVAGSFIVNGVVEPATGSGRLLIGNVNNPNTADLQVRVLLDSSQIHGGIEAELSLTRGITSRIDQYLSDFLDSEKGTLTTAKASFDSQNESINQSIERVNQVTASKREYLLKQFAALERALSALQTTSSVVSSQLAGLQRLR
ncbi:MAG TPA: flagellar filament capping protein FliD, partial [Pirellulaceae bacterium]|nr:flagellar filament capping protein FliD [Pirellulaceae bacterium]